MWLKGLWRGRSTFRSECWRGCIEKATTNVNVRPRVASQRSKLIGYAALGQYRTVALSGEETRTPLTLRDGRYELTTRIGKGGMGAVYLGRQVDLDRPVAIKLLHPQYAHEPGLVSRFRQEAKAAKSLTHPNTVRIYDFGESKKGQLFLVLEYLEGISLDRLLARKGKLPIALLIRVAVQVLKSLIEAHHYGIVHRDLKPSNLMLCVQPGEPDHIKVLDFGVARLTEGAAHKTATGIIVGTPHYMSPEQAMAEPVTERSDIYSLGITLLELATGDVPYTGDSPLRVAMGHIDPNPVPMPADFEATTIGPVVRKACSKKPADRYASAEEMLAALGPLRGAGNVVISGVMRPEGVQASLETVETAADLSFTGVDRDSTVVDSHETETGFPYANKTPRRVAIAVVGAAVLLSVYWVISQTQLTPTQPPPTPVADHFETELPAAESPSETAVVILDNGSATDVEPTFNLDLSVALGEGRAEVLIAAESARVVALRLVEEQAALEDNSEHDRPEEIENSPHVSPDEESSSDDPSDEDENHVAETQSVDDPESHHPDGTEQEIVEDPEPEPDGTGSGFSTPYIF